MYMRNGLKIIKYTRYYNINPYMVKFNYKIRLVSKVLNVSSNKLKDFPVNNILQVIKYKINI